MLRCLSSASLHEYGSGEGCPCAVDWRHGCSRWREEEEEEEEEGGAG